MPHSIFATALRAAVLALGLAPSLAAASALPTQVPAGTRLVVADQNEELQTQMIASGEHAKLTAAVTYANFLGGPAILEAFRAGALDLATVGNAPPIQAQAAGETLPIVAARRSSEPDYSFAVRPGLTVKALEEFRGKRIAYAEGTGRQPFVLTALKLAGLTRKDVTLVPLRAADFPDAVRSGQVDIAALNEPHFSRYLADYADRGASAVPDAEHDRLPRGLTYLYASGAALEDPAKAAAIRQFVLGWIAANGWSKAHPADWVAAYYVRKQKLKEADGLAIVKAAGDIAFPPLESLIAPQQATIDLIYAAGDLKKPLDAREEFDLRFDEVIKAATN
ncbi:MAG TPA: ABC transporter substrate-binding protein [Xanthobacteraceae bacterium]|nr:ABC transporter substrate-binding protein [Xanthobacteraceae bacterium]